MSVGNTTMSSVHHSAGSKDAWHLARQQVRRMTIGPGPRRLQVQSGCLWLTIDRAGDAAEDVWLTPGDSVELPTGARLLLEAWPEARFDLLVPPTACAEWQRGAAPGWLARLSGWFASSRGLRPGRRAQLGPAQA